MSTNVTLNGNVYSIPVEGDDNWGPGLSAYLIAIASGVLQKTGGNFTLSSDIDFGANYGIKSAYVISKGTNPASSGVLRLANNELISWRNAANNADLSLTLDNTNTLLFNGIPFLAGLITNANVDPSAGIVYSKLNLTDGIVNSDVNASAAILYSKLNLSNSIRNADVASNAFINVSKLGSGSVTNTEFDYLSGASSNIQTQINTIAAASFLPPGTLVDFAGSAAPSGWLLCYGQAISRSTYSALFTAIGINFGAGDGSTTFNVPDLRGRVTVGKDNMGGAAANRMTTGGSGVDGATLGANGGSQTVTLSQTEMPSHTHTQNAHTHTQNAHDHLGQAFSLNPTNPSGTNFGTRDYAAGPVSSYANFLTGTTTATNQNTTAVNQNTGGGAAHNNTQPSTIINKIIKT